MKRILVLVTFSVVLAFPPIVKAQVYPIDYPQTGPNFVLEMVSGSVCEQWDGELLGAGEALSLFRNSYEDFRASFPREDRRRINYWSKKRDPSMLKDIGANKYLFVKQGYFFESNNDDKKDFVVGTNWYDPVSEKHRVFWAYYSASKKLLANNNSARSIPSEEFKRDLEELAISKCLFEIKASEYRVDGLADSTSLSVSPLYADTTLRINVSPLELRGLNGGVVVGRNSGKWIPVFAQRDRYGYGQYQNRLEYQPLKFLGWRYHYSEEERQQLADKRRRQAERMAMESARNAELRDEQISARKKSSNAFIDSLQNLDGCSAEYIRNSPLYSYAIYYGFEQGVVEAVMRESAAGQSGHDRSETFGRYFYDAQSRSAHIEWSDGSSETRRISVSREGYAIIDLGVPKDDGSSGWSRLECSRR